MDRTKLTLMKGFYENELINNILPFWLNRSIDEECGGFFSCFDKAKQSDYHIKFSMQF